ncbi:MAG: phosphoribosylaminoimidazolesuccinocarboxamide synthase, partial [Candidatus Krumholzibacteria bacterium]|nr:phosphoribosylaminoimidazolesuccinocarboxamide synthase [Candidatus Krumholzibacteria bacterium]
MNEKKPAGYSGLPGIKPAYKGKVRDIFDLNGQLIIVASDRVSAYDSVIPTPIPAKGAILTMISAQWFKWF